MEAIFSYLAGAFDLPILLWIKEHLWCAFGDAVFPVVTLLGESGIFCIILALVLILVPKTRRTGIAVGASLLLGLILCNILLKPLMARIRPYTFMLENHGVTIPLIVEELKDFSFPSGHTIACFETALVLIKHYKKWGITALVLAALVAFSRLYLFVHYPTDVLAAIAMAFLTANLAEWLTAKGYTYFEKKKRRGQ